MKRIIGGSMQRQSIDEYFLNPGELIFSKKPIVIKTVLGSCVAVILHDKEKKIGAMCHYLLPEAPSDAQSSTKYGDVAIYTLLYKFLKENKCRREDLVASICGGAFIIFDEREIFFIGDKNVEIATNILRKEKILVKQMHTGGDHGKRILYNTYTNKTIVQTLDRLTIDDLYNNF
ncbi:MAG TPA: chemotaxis protein CheD [Spirochaetota bacterium]|jgi:chemotaxis protein CheD|nr:chemotaxis protein CheD [Spirochaetota bacterium]